MTDARAVRWNNNIHYHRRILDAVPAGARTALDFGTGNGLLAADLHERVPDVTGIDIDAAVLGYTRRHGIWEHSAPIVWPPPHTYADVKRSTARMLGGATWSRLPMWRYLVVWHKPPA
ncbi:bifunctional 2-polyprenyl-6-hydroxyphenol methylase/3-demethylubiquinol 3-O-methyltransferase UbiG [Microbacterium sp. AK031]|uniref:class I SAM-dependent methyltransferase n=1 Tax=Microbacterium sp. AK031 TaxID=2723076 RepID=UPI002168DB7A|nr:hypothetical protein [Microbacterium sp. AK031]MCS3844440.1 SAM-dependent methyltransferase [Microbacterium sp. AK031]